MSFAIRKATASNTTACKGTSKEQAITIQASGGLSDDDIEKMVKDAEANADADKARRGLVETRNQAESLLHSTKKSLAEHSDKVDPSTVEMIELAMSALEDTVKTDLDAHDRRPAERPVARGIASR